MSESVPARLRGFVQERARGRCEYCLLHEDDSMAPHEPDHIIAVKHGGPTALENLAWTCMFCNRRKGTDIFSIDYRSGRPARLFNPRRDKWKTHFRFDGRKILPITAVGRATERLLQFNRIDFIVLRESLVAEGRFPDK